LKIRDFFLENTVRDIYQGIGQVLSAVRLELSAAQPDPESIRAAGDLVGQSIRDLRIMSRNFNPDTVLLEQEGFTESIKRVIAIACPEKAPVVSCKEQWYGIRPEIKLIAFYAFLEMVITLKEKEKTCSSVLVSSTKMTLNIALSFDSRREEVDQESSKEEMAGFHRTVALLEGNFRSKTRRDGITTWKLTIPIK
jgi:hypothetical protein